MSQKTNREGFKKNRNCRAERSPEASDWNDFLTFFTDFHEMIDVIMDFGLPKSFCTELLTYLEMPIT